MKTGYVYSDVVKLIKLCDVLIQNYYIIYIIIYWITKLN